MTEELFLEASRQIVGENHVLTGGDLTAWEVDWRQRSRGTALAVIRPGSTSEVADIVRLCAKYQQSLAVSLVPQGGNTGLVAGSIPNASGQQIVLSMTRMKTVRSIDSANLTITAEAGCVLQSIQQAAQDQGLLFPLSLAAEGSCTLGGNLGTNAGGTQVLRYGNARDLCLGLEVVTAQGAIWHGLSGLRKDNTGYDLTDLFIGSEGTLGIITAATMKLFPVPCTQLTAWASVPSLTQAVRLLAIAHKHLGADLTGFEVMGQFALDLVHRHFSEQQVPFLRDGPWCVLIEVSDYESDVHARSRLENLLEAALSDGCVTDAVIAQTQAQASALWHIRESIPLAQPMEGPNIKHDVSIPISNIAEFVRQTDALLEAKFTGVRLVNFGHLGDGNLHYNVQAPHGANASNFLHDCEEAVNTMVYDSVTRFGGSISAEHGVGSLKVSKLEKYKSPVALDMMRRIKHALDPTGLMNPGRVVQLERSDLDASRLRS
jgi:FAD/FMN-containing dehydrogenase